MKKYMDIEIELIALQTQDIVTLSDFDGGDHEFGNPNSSNDGNYSDNA